MFELVERDYNNCKYLNSNIVRIKKLKVELLRNPLHFEYEIYKQNDEDHTETLEYKNIIIIEDFESPWLRKRIDDVYFYRKHNDSIFLNVESDFANYYINYYVKYRINEGDWVQLEYSFFSLTYCMIDPSSCLLASIVPDDVYFNCNFVHSDDSKTNFYIIGLKNIIDSYIIEFDILTETFIRKDFRIQIKNEKENLISVRRITFLVEIVKELESQ